MVRAGIIGCGNIAFKWDNPKGPHYNTHAKSYFNEPSARLVSCSDIIFDRAREMARVYPGVIPYRDYREMFRKERLDVVSVCATTSAHYNIIKWILENSGVRYILAEKPLTYKISQTAELADLAKKKGAYIAVNYLRRWDESINRVKGRIIGGEFGGFQAGRAVYYGGFLQNAVHLVDLLLLFGHKPDFSLIASIVKLYKDDFGASILLKTKDGKPVFFSWVDGKDYPYLELDLFYKKARVRIGDQGEVDIFKVRRSCVYPDFQELAPARRYPSTISKAMKNSVSGIVKAFRAQSIDHGPLKNEMEIIRLASEIWRKARRP
ncbi:MAG: Gfo/Idh/MocA family oxidoreductase [Candidatus Omnitrophica bacterium]|nr:Gfo/Idh/MocA family oxidoreductase [Candidatus Omnitrophota bacterium]MDD5310582.1 Gfo/Idh/MocA family oxidoreductase [Candidatus Omnitrophota bacterium]MDD5545992.1 Gfo/Idh/MocA family oxidoreductase [Candidatus Omnitrophota bacterium]